MSVLNIRDLTKVYQFDVCALNGVNLSIKKGDFFSILGKNGAGKSTIIGIITSLIKKTSGKVYVCSYDLDSDFVYIKSLIGVVPQDFNFNQFETVLDIILNQAGFYGFSKSVIIDRAKFLLELFDLWDKRFSLSMNLSGGMKRRLMFVRALIHDPEILILDEPTAGVDLFSRKLILGFLKDLNKLGKTIILTTHYFEEIEELCNKIIIIDKGVVLKESNVIDLKIKLNENVFVLKIDDVNKLNNINNFNFKFVDKNTIELFLTESCKLNYFLKVLVDNDVYIYNITNKHKTLEEFFVDILT